MDQEVAATLNSRAFRFLDDAAKRKKKTIIATAWKYSLMNRAENSLLYESHYQTKIVSGKAVKLCVYVCI